MTEWEKFKAQNGMRTNPTRNQQEEDELKKYKEESARRKYENLKKLTDKKPLGSSQTFNPNNPEFQQGRANLYQKQQRQRAAMSSEIDSVLNGTGVPQELKKFNADFNAIPDQAKGLVHAYAEKYPNVNDDVSVGRAPSQKQIQASNDANQIKALTGMDDVSGLLAGAKKMRQYQQDAKEGKNLGGYLSPAQQQYKAITEMEKMPEEIRNDFAELGQMKNQQVKNKQSILRDANDKNMNSLVDAGIALSKWVSDKDIKNKAKEIQNKWKLSDEDMKKYSDYQDYISTAQFQADNNLRYAIDPNASAGQKWQRGIQNSLDALSEVPFKAAGGVASHLTDRNKTLGYNTNSYLMTPIISSEEAQNQVLEAIGDDTFWKKAGQFAYSTGMTTAEAGINILAGAATGGGEALTLAQFAGQSYASTYREAKNNGLSDKNANRLGIASAAIETGTELISLDHLYDMYKAGKKTAVKALADLAVQGGIEGSEEAASDILNRLSQYMFIDYTGLSDMDRSIQKHIENGEDPETAKKNAEKDFWIDVAKDAGSGFVSGLALGAPSLAMSANSATNRANVDRSDITSAYNEELKNNPGESREDKIAKAQAEKYASNPVRAQVDMIDDSTDKGKATKAEAMKYADKYEKNGKLSNIDNLDLQNLLDANEETSYSKYRQYVNEITEAPISTGMNEREFRQKIVEAAKTGNVEAMADAYDQAKHSTSSELQANVDTVMDEFKGMAENAGITPEQFEAAKMTTEEAYEAGYSGEFDAETEAELNRFIDNLAPFQKEAYNEGKQIKIKERAEEVNSVAETYANDFEREAFKKTVNDNIEVKQFTEAFDSILDMGKTGSDLKGVLKTPSAILVGEETAKTIYNVGKKTFENDFRADMNKNAQQKLGVKKGTGLFEDKTVNTEISDDAKLVYGTMAQSFGFNLNVVDPGNVDGSGVQASFNPKTSTITVASNNNLQSMHEVAEFVEFHASKEYEKVRVAALELARQELGEKEYNRIAQLYHDKYLEKFKGETRYDSSTEMANDVVAALMGKSSMQKKFAKHLIEKYGSVEGQHIGQKLYKTFSQLLDAFKSLFANTNMNSFQRRIMETELQKQHDVMDKFLKALDEAVKNYNSLQSVEQRTNDTINKIGLEYDSATESINPSSFSLDTWTGSDYVQKRKESIDAIAEALGISKKKATEYIDNINSIAKMIADDRVRLDYDADPNNSSVVSNTEYGASIDFSTICKKRLLYTGTMQEIQKQIGNRVITMEDYLNIRNAMLEDGLQTTCGCCYVEGSRVKLGQYMEQFIKRYAKSNPAYVPTMYEVTMPDGIRQLRAQHPEAWQAREYFLNHFGQIEGQEGNRNLFGTQQKPKDYTERTEYRGELLDMFLNKSEKVAEKNKNGGLRLQSFSDFEIVNLIDCMQVIMDMSRCGLAGQAYTKVYEFADALGNTRLKINLSLMGAGVDANGDLILDEVNGMSKKDAIELRNKYSKNVGTIVVAFTDEQIRAALKSDYVDFVIPFHRSQWRKSQFDALGLPENTKDYTMHQNDRKIQDNGRLKRAAKNIAPNEYWDFSKSGRENAQTYIDYCNDNRLAPKFAFLLEKDSNGKYYLPEGKEYDGYFKLLIDFKMYDNDGVGSPQMPVQPNFSMEEAKKMLNDYTGGHESFPVAQEIADRFAKQIIERGGEFKYSLDVDSDGNQLTENQVKYFKDSTIRDENGNLKVMYHGTKESFTIFDPLKLGGLNGTAEGYGLYFADDSKVANAYGDNVMKGYLNITKPARFDQNKIKQNDLAKLIKATCEKEAQSFMEDGYDSIKDAIKDTWISNYVDTYGMSIDQAYREVAKSILDMNNNDMHVVQEVMVGMGIRNYADAYDFYDTLTDTLGIDGFIAEWEDSSTGKKTEVAVALYSEQFKNIDNLDPTSNPDVRYSIELYGDIEYAKVDNVPEDFDSLNENEKRDRAEAIIKELFYNGNYIQDRKGSKIYRHHNAANHYAHAERRQYTQEENDAKFKSAAYLPDIMRSSRYIGTDLGDSVFERHSDARYGISKYRAIIRIGKSWYTCVINVFNRENRREFYDITKIDTIMHTDVTSLMEALDYYDNAYYRMIDHYKEIDNTKNFKYKNFSLEFDDEDWALFGGIQPTITNESILDQGLKALKGKEVNTRAINTIATQLKTEFASTIDKKQFADMLGRAFTYLHTQDNITFNDVMAIFEEVARPVIDQATRVENADMYRDFTEYFKGRKIKLTDTQMAEVKSAYGSYADFQKAMYPLQFSVKGETTLDDMWIGLAEYFQGMIEYDTVEGDMPMALNDVLEALRPSPVNTFGANTEEVGKDLAMRIVEGYLTMQSDAKLQKAVNQLRGAQKQYRSDVRARYQQRLKDYKTKAKDERNEYTEKLRKAYQDRLGYQQRKAKVDKDWALAEQSANYQERLDYEQRRAGVEKDWALAEQRQKYEGKLAEERANAKFDREMAKFNQKDQRLQFEAKIADIKAKSKDKMSNYKDRQKANAQKKEIAKIVTELSNRIMNPTENKHVPSEMVGKLVSFLQCFNFVEPEVKFDAKNKQYTINMLDFNEMVNGVNHNHMMTLTGKTRNEVLDKFYAAFEFGAGNQTQKRWQERMKEIQELFGQSTNADSEMEDVIALLDPTLAQSLGELIEKNNHVLSINNLNTEDLITVKTALKSLLHAINKQNEAFTIKAEISDIAHSIQENAAKVRAKDHTVAYGKIDEWLRLNMMTPETYFSLLGKGGEKIYDALARAYEDKIGYIHKTEKFVNGLNINQREARQWRKDIHTFDTSEGQIKMTTAQIMSLYELMKRNQAMLHSVGGFKVGKLNEGLIERYQNGIHLSDSELHQITSALTDEQKRIADSFQKYMATECGSWGNKASMMMYDFEKFLDPNYFPIKTDSDTNQSTNTENQVNLLNGIERMGFTKAVVKNANNPIIIDDIFSVFTSHVTDMAAYASFAPTIKDALRVYNYKEVIQTGDYKNYIPVKRALNESMGRKDGKGKKYFDDLIRSINGSERSGHIKNFGEQLVGNYKAAAVGANIRVVVQQPTAYIRAATLINPKYLVEATPKAFLHNMEKLKESNELIYWKSKGYYEASLGKNVEDIILGSGNVKDKLVDASMWLAGKADDMTWACLYNAAERQIKADNSGLTGDDYKAKVDELFRQVIHQTQVVDATIMKSPWQRSQDGKDKLMNAFMSEPIKAYNIMMKSLIQAKRGDVPVKTVVAAGGALLATDMVNALAQAMVDALRYHEDDDEYMEDLMNYWLSNLKDNVNPIAKVPFLKDAWSIGVKAFTGELGYGQTSGQLYEYAALENIARAIDTTKKIIDGKYTKTPYAAYMDYARAFSQFTGVPAYNFSRDAVAAWNMFANDDMKLVKNYERPTDKYNNIISVIDKGKAEEYIDEAVKKALEKNGTTKDISSKLVSSYKQDYLEALANDDAISDELFESAVKGYMAIGLSRADAEAEVESWTDVKVGYSDLDKAIANSDGLELATKIVMENKETDKILDHIYNSYSGTIEFNRAKGYQSDIESNVNKVLNQVAGIDYDGLVEMREQKELEKQQKAEQAAANKAAKEAKEQLKTNLYNAIDNGSNYKLSVDAMVRDGLEYKDIKSAITEKYKSDFVAAYNSGNKQKATQIKQRVATVKAYCDAQTGLNIPKKYKGDYYQYELDHVDEWLK